MMPFASMTPPNDSTSFVISTDSIDKNGMIDSRYTCDLDNSSPELRWNKTPENTQEFALIAEDLDSHPGIATHWIIYRIPPSIHHLPAGIPPQESLPNGIRQGVNSFGKLGYAGPCPPLGGAVHRYRFCLFALKENPALTPRIQRDDLMRVISPLILVQAEIIGKYRRVLQRTG